MMKKIGLFVVALGLITLTGCTKTTKLNCTNEQNIENTILTNDVIITFENDYATKTQTTTTAVFENEDMATSYADEQKKDETISVKQDGSKVTIKSTQVVSKSAVKTEVNKKENVKTALEETGFKCE